MAMQTKNPKPSYVTSFNRLAGTEIKYIGGHWYLYERKTVYDPGTKKKRKKSGAMLGTIREDGLRPKKSTSATSINVPSEIQCVEYAASEYLYQSNQRMIERLKASFPRDWEKIFSMAALKCIGETSLKRMPAAFEGSWLSIVFKNIHIHASTLSTDIKRIGRQRGSICRYMRASLDGFSGFVLIDGHRIISSSSFLPYAQLGYDSRMRYSPQVNLLYLFENNSDGRMPLYYKQFAGSVPDCIALPDIAKESSVSGTNITVIADKGFCDADDFSAIIGSGMHYIIPLKRNTVEIKDMPTDHTAYETVFNFRERSVYCNQYKKDGYLVYLYYDMLLAMYETKDTVERLNRKNALMTEQLQRDAKRSNRSKRKLTAEQIEEMKPVDVALMLRQKPDIGTLILRTDRYDLNEAQVYALYKTRQEIEQSFKCYDDTLELEASYMQDTDSFEGWLFINHLALQMLYGTLDYIAQAELTSRYSFKDIIRTLEGIRANKINGEWYATKYTRHAKKLCSDLGIIINDPVRRDT
jgi:transposase